jgi:iron complex outermembrane receptor protein
MVIGSRLLRSGCASLALAAALLAAPAGAQSTQPDEAPQTDAEGNPAAGAEEIVVTGSRIRRNPLDLDAPVTFVDEDDIAKTGLNSINDVLQRLPSSGGGLSSPSSTIQRQLRQSAGRRRRRRGRGRDRPSLSELAPRARAGRRPALSCNGASASGVPGSTDLNSIPESAIERVEVLQDGASAIYGSDAIAGVVNIITKSNQRGFVGSAQAGVYDRGDGLTQNYQLSWGNGDEGPLEIVVGGNYVDQDPVSSGDRALSRFPEPYDTLAGTPARASRRTGASPARSSCGGAAGRTLIAPVIGRRADAGRLPDLRRRARPVQLPAVQLPADPAPPLRARSPTSATS